MSFVRAYPEKLARKHVAFMTLDDTGRNLCGPEELKMSVGYFGVLHPAALTEVAVPVALTEVAVLHPAGGSSATSCPAALPEVAVLYPR